ncbi:MAG: T9SS type A sorting domain-containing protein [Actinobacteria bacterium]|nr:T9SS type A sorting domain-containing protein [Actinomycetota bacterium]
MCHNNPALGDMTGWRTSMHANGYSVVLDDSHTMQDLYGIINDYDQNQIDDFHDGLDFNTISSVFNQYKPNAPVLAYSAENGYTITIGNATHRVYLTYGGSGLYKQRYGVKINTAEGESKDIYISPIQFNEKTHQYVLYHPDAWYDESSQPKYSTASTLADAAGNSRSLAKGCSGCHVTGLTLDQTTNGEWVAHGAGIDPTTAAFYADKSNIFDLDGDGDIDQINTGCEQCHGMGGDHASAPSKTNIINPDDLSTEQANNICGMCHSRGKSLPNGTFSFPYHDDTMTSWTPGVDLVADIYSDGGGYWGDGVNSKKHHQQFYDFYKSEKPTFKYHQVRCSECHDVHNTVKHHIKASVVETDSLDNEIIITTENDNNTLCLSCHATHGDFASIPVEWVADYANHVQEIGAIVSEHTNHPYDPDGSGASRCSKCHMPKVAKSAIAYDIHSHTFEPIPPQKTLLYNMPSACAVSCHMKDDLNFGIDFSNDNLTKWDEPSDIALADTLMKYYGPDGKWWQLDVTSVDRIAVDIPQDFSLLQNYPNPFNPTTVIPFKTASNGFVTLKVYNVQGQIVATLVNKEMSAGSYQVVMDGYNLPSGVYFYKLKVGDYVQTNKMMLMK